jgi:hypothetical protein
MEDRQLKEIRQHFERMKKRADGMRNFVLKDRE